MSDLRSKQCVACRKGMPTLTEQEQQALLPQLKGWTIVGGHHLVKSYKFSDYSGGLIWVNRLSALAEELEHHPDVSLVWGEVQLSIWSHVVDGLTESDFILAAKIDALEEKV